MFAQVSVQRASMFYHHYFPNNVWNNGSSMNMEEWILRQMKVKVEIESSSADQGLPGWESDSTLQRAKCKEMKQEIKPCREPRSSALPRAFHIARFPSSHMPDGKVLFLIYSRGDWGSECWSSLPKSQYMVALGFGFGLPDPKTCFTLRQAAKFGHISKYHWLFKNNKL